MKTIMIIAIYANGDRAITETPEALSPRDWRAAMKQVGLTICATRMPFTAIVISGNDVYTYNANEVVEIFGA